MNDLFSSGYDVILHLIGAKTWFLAKIGNA